MTNLFSEFALRLNSRDNIAIAKQEITAGTVLAILDGDLLTITDSIPAGHKFALAPIVRGESIFRYGYAIGHATCTIAPGNWVHSHNLSCGDLVKNYDYQIVAPLTPQSASQTFMGYRRADGHVGTRNYIAVISTVNCAAHVTTQIARTFTPDRLAPFSNIDGVIPIVHHTGCSIVPSGIAHRYLQRTLANIARNPNIGGYIVVGLGCEVCQMNECFDVTPIPESIAPNGLGLVIQDQGGFRKTVDAGVHAIEQLLPQVNTCARTPQPISELTIAVQCGGSDSWSGVTANPLVGLVVDRVVWQGGTAVLAETPETFGAEHLLLQRVTRSAVGEKLIARFNEWNEQSKLLNFTVDNNPTPGNKKGGLTTILEKSLGAVAKGGSTPLNGAYEYAERVTQRGLVFMDTPGNDPISVTGQLAGGCNLILFTTGRGSVYGSIIAPCIKVATNNTLYTRMSDDMDFNAGKILLGTSQSQAADELLELVIAVASGQKTKNEEKGLSENEFVPWQPGPVV